MHCLPLSFAGRFNTMLGKDHNVSDWESSQSGPFADGSNYRAVGANAVPAGKHAVVMNFAYDGGGMGKSGTATVLVDGTESIKVRVVKTIPFRFAGDLGKVVINLK